MEGFALLALVVIVFWIGGYVVYLVTSRRQVDIEDEISHIDSMLESETGEEFDG